MSGSCAVAGCGRAVVAHGLCRSHYDRKRRVGSPIGPSDVPLPHCRLPTCERVVDHHNARYCAAHASRAAEKNPPQRFWIDGPPPQIGGLYPTIHIDEIALDRERMEQAGR